MALSTLSSNDIRIIQDMMSEHASSIPSGVIRSSILSLQGPVIEYVSKYVPAEYDDSFEDIETWLNTLSDLMVRRSCSTSSPKSSAELSGEDSPMVSRERCLRPSEKKSRFLGRIRIMDPYRKGTRPLVMTEFRKNVAIILLILSLALLITEDNPALLFAVEKIQDNKIKIMETLINKYSEKNQKELDRLIEEGKRVVYYRGT